MGVIKNLSIMLFCFDAHSFLTQAKTKFLHPPPHPPIFSSNPPPPARSPPLPAGEGEGQQLIPPTFQTAAHAAS